MSILSQFFPAGKSLKIDFLLVGGGGGGGASGGATPTCFRAAGGGGGGGQVVLGEDYEVTPGRSYPIVIGSGGAGGGFSYLASLGYTAPVTPYTGCAVRAQLRGSDGGDSFFGSVKALGGGGGGSGFHCPTVCGEFSHQGRSDGTGGGSGGCMCQCSPSNSFGGTAVSSFSIGNTVKSGSPAANGSDMPSAWSTTGPSYPITVCAKCYYILASGGGGNATFSASGSGTIELTTPFTWSPPYNVSANFYPVACGQFDCSRTWVPRKWCGSLTGGGGSSNSFAPLRFNNHSERNHGGDGAPSTISGSLEYYGGGGSVAYSVSPYGSINTGISYCPTSPVFPSSPVHYKCIYGGAGGGAYMISSVACPVSPYTLCRYYCSAAADFCACRPGGDPTTIIICNAPTGSGGGGMAHHVNGFSSTGPVFPGTNGCAYCGTAGGGGTLIIRYPTVFAAATVSGNTPTPAQPGYHVYKWNGPGSITFN